MCNLFEYIKIKNTQIFASSKVFSLVSLNKDSFVKKKIHPKNKKVNFTIVPRDV